MKRLLLGLALSLAVFAAHAQSSSVNTQDISSCGAASATCATQNANACGAGVTCGSIGTGTAQLCVPAATGAFVRVQLTIANSAASGGSTISWGYNASITLNGVGTQTLSPGGSSFWPRGTAPGQAIYCVASGSATPMQIVLGD